MAKQRIVTLPEWDVAQWFGTSAPLTLAGLRDKVVALYVFQILCPGCVSDALPQAKRLAATFPAEHLATVGLHSVFEHHAAMTPVALEAFLHEYRLGFPVGVDCPDGAGGLPLTMRRYALRGTPSLLLIDRRGRLRAHHFGHVDDLRLGAEVMALVQESLPTKETAELDEASCAAGLCAVA